MAFVDMITLQPAKNIELLAPMITLCIDRGRKYKIRADDILDALAGDVNIDNKVVSKIDITDNYSYDAIERGIANQAVKQLADDTVKDRKLRVWKAR